MKALKGILVGLIVTLVLILVVGGALIGFNHEGHGDSSDKNKSAATEPKDGHGSNNQSSAHEDAKGKVVIAKEQVAPEEYLKRIQEAQNLIKEATALMTNEAYVTQGAQPNGTQGNDESTSSPSSNVGGMDKMHQGIYKLAQGMTLMDLAVKDMNQEIVNAKGANINYYMIPSNPQINYYYNPYFNPYNQYNSNNHNVPNVGNSNNHQNTDPSAHGAGGHGASLGGLFNTQNISYAIYGFLVISLLGVFIAIFGMIGNLFKPTPKSVEK